MRTPNATPLPWREITSWALLGTLLITMWAFLNVMRSGPNAVNFIQPGERARAATAFHADFPKLELPDTFGLDGEQFYVIARNPLHPREVAPLLDRPRYRLQRPLLAWLAWLLHPTGGGVGLVWALVAVNVLAILAGSLATGALSVLLGGRPWLAAFFAMTPGAWYSLRVSVADALALALCVAALALAHRQRWTRAILCAVAAVLAKEVIIVVIIGWAMWRRTRRAVLLAAIPIAVALAWWVALRLVISSDTSQVGELVAPLTGWRDAWIGQWSQGQQLVGMAAAIGSTVLGAGALVRRGLSHPLGWTLVGSLALAALGSEQVIGNNYGSTRTLMPMMVLGLVAWFTDGERAPTDPQRRS